MTKLEFINELKLFPQKYLSLLNNEFYSQNIHFHLNEDYIETDSDGWLVDNHNIEKIYYQINKIFSYEYDVQVYDWGVAMSPLSSNNKDENVDVLIIIDYEIVREWEYNVISVYFFNKENKYKNFSKFHNHFKEINEKENCFYVNETGKDDLVVSFIQKEHGNLIDYYDVKKAFFNYDTNYDELQVIDLLNEFGGEEFIFELFKEREEKKIQIAKEFQNNKFIENIKIEKFKIFEDEYSIDLSEINIIIGKNSMGKTSILQALALGLVPENTNQITQKSQDKYKNYINQKAGNSKIKELSKAKISLKWKTNKEVKRSIYNKKSNRNNLAFREQNIYVDNLVSDKKEIPQTYLVLAYGENLFPDREASETVAYQFIDYLKIGKYNNINVESLFSYYYKKLINPLYILNKLQKNELPSGFSELEIEELSAIKNELFKTLNKFLNIQQADTFEIKLINNRYKFTDKVGNEFDLYQLSEGYRTNISLITDILTKIFASRNTLFIESYEHTEFDKILKNVRGTILIDEFDKHLHPIWQKSFVGILKEQLPKIQFVLTTHNVVALQSAEGQTAIKLSANENGKIIIEEKIIQKGNSIETLLNLFFDWDSQFYGNEIQNDSVCK